jgi:DNA polymerase I-like protein with 3'-5' exonuclease and polymerase domains
MAKIQVNGDVDSNDIMMSFEEGIVEKAHQTVKERDWIKNKQFVLATPENLTSIVDVCIESGLYALDLETTGLDNRINTDSNGIQRTIDQISGVCLSPDGVRGYYIPLRHYKLKMDGTPKLLDCNISLDLFDKEFRRLMEATENGKTIAVFHNAKFDQEFLDYNWTGKPYGNWGKVSTWHDTMILAFLTDSRQRVGLKELTNEHLKIDQIELKELFEKGEEENFSLLDPENPQTVWYAAGDAIFTRLHCDVYLPLVLNPDTDGRSQKNIYEIEKSCSNATRWMERNRIHVNREKIKELIVLGHKEWFDCIWEVYREAEIALGRNVIPGAFKYLKETFAFDDPTNPITMQKKSAEDIIKKKPDQGIKDYVDSTEVFSKTIKDDKGKNATVDFPAIYDITNPPEIGQMLLEMGVPDLPRTEKSGQVQTSAGVLDNIIDDHADEFPFVKKVKRFREVNKALSTYLYAMYNDCDSTNDTMRIGFRQLGTDTGRFNTRAGGKDTRAGWPRVNLQAIPRSGSADRPECMQRMRECISSRKPDSFIVAIDYSGVELRIVTNLSREPLWLNEFFRCAGCGREFSKGDGVVTPEPPPPRCPNCGSDKIGDLHTLTGLNIFGMDAIGKPDWKDKRGQAKGTNFALCYGGSGSAVCRSTGVDKNEGRRIEQQFKAAYKGLQVWWGEQHKFARQHGYVRDAFARKYPVPDIKHGDGGLRSKAERNSINGPIQATSATITKIAMAMIYKKMKELNWLDKVRMVITMHDELVFDIDGDVLEEAINIIRPIMTSNSFVKNLKWSVPLTCDVEIGHDWSVPWDLNGMRFKEVRFIGNKKYKDAKKLPEGQLWEQLPSVPEDLTTFLKLEDKFESPVEVPPMSVETIEVKKSTITLPEYASALPAGEVFEFRLKEDLSFSLIKTLSDVIIYCWGKGTHRLKVITKDGEDLTNILYQKPPFNGKPVTVNGVEFHIIATSQGL